MAFELTIDDFKTILDRVVEKFQQHKDDLNDLDTKVGDGDHGLSMTRGFLAVQKYAKEQDPEDIKTLLLQGGMQFNEAAGSTIGILMLSAMMEASKRAGNDESVGMDDLISMLEGAIEGIKKRGKAEPGQKTIIDSLHESYQRISRLREEGKNSPAELAKAAVQAAEDGVQKTKDMKSSQGRGKWFSERSIGVIDPGAVSGKLIIEAFAEHIVKQKTS